MINYKKDLQQEQKAHVGTKAKVAELENTVSLLKDEVASLKKSLSEGTSGKVDKEVYKDLLRKYTELESKPKEVIVRRVKVVDLSLVSKRELRKALKDAT